MDSTTNNPVQVDATHSVDTNSSEKNPETQSNAIGANPAPKAVSAPANTGIEMTVIRSSPSVRVFLLC